jgi:predicted component of type VI protein secretion system
MAESMATARFVLAAVEPGSRIEVPAAMQVGDSLPVPAAAAGRWLALGSGPDQDIVIRDEPRTIRRSHCRITYRGSAYQIQSRLHPDGLAINGEYFHDCTARALHDGAMIRIGSVTFRFAL